ncbi:hypothetical protein FKW77_010358 [Venturia effusa]|uniref:Heterokaryon incompatibility domain-containing protein n=1 Tax=Venturia effusa TaxID=50376 RepID=A0A517L6F5_9PEZI|nr:hypothetical protein FKW77_010358 [Venturia effusa]
MSDPLCEVCERLDLVSVFRREYRIKVSENETHLGVVADIRERSAVCTLCAIITKELDQEVVEADDICYLRQNIYCTVWTDGLGDKLGCQCDDDSEGESIARFEVMLAPAVTTGFTGPLLPFGNHREEVQRTRPRGLLQFQQLEDERADSGHARGRVVNPRTADLKLVAKWLSLCEACHGQRCCKESWAKLNPPIDGLLLIDIDLDCIVEAPNDYRYVALSYCWGDAPTLKHLLANSIQLRTPGFLSTAAIPATIRDAMVLTASLRERYLWVDALCIVQDDPIASQQQLSQMGEIYSQALLTIIAAAGPRADSGLHGVRVGSRNTSRSTLNLDQSRLRLTTVVDKSDDFANVSQTAWNTRAWTMQEKLLSRRRLIFTKDQVYWRCRSSTWLEEVRLEDTSAQRFFMGVSKVGEIDEISPENAHRFNMGTTKPGDVDPSMSVPKHESQSSRLFRLHTTLVGTYLRRYLGYYSDSLNAVSGILHILSNLYQEETFIWGLLESHFTSGLNWAFRGGGKGNNASTTSFAPSGLKAEVKFPSWSWTSCGGGLNQLWYDSPPIHQEIVFYREGVTGELLQIQESSSQIFISEQKVPSHWKEMPQIVETSISTMPPSFIDSGILTFYSSIATCTLYRHKVPDNKLAGYDRGHFLRLESSDDMSSPHCWLNIYDLLDEDILPWQPRKQDVSITTSSLDLLTRTIGDDASRVLSESTTEVLFDASVIVFGRQDGDDLVAFIVRYDQEDGIPFRIGLAKIREEFWNRVSNREWRLIRLK